MITKEEALTAYKELSVRDQLGAYLMYGVTDCKKCGEVKEGIGNTFTCKKCSSKAHDVVKALDGNIPEGFETTEEVFDFIIKGNEES